MHELPKAYVPKDAEERWYPFWERNGFFRARATPGKKPYTIVIPPPNITGSLTMGHILNNSIQDVYIRWKRMQGYEALWVPGTDHAGIATQNVVEKSLAKEGKNRHHIGRDEFVKLVWKWKEAYGGTIIKQLRKLGTTCDWERERFTMDEGLSSAVQEMFIRLYAKGLIYRGKYIVNWCPKDHTAISDDEVTFVEQKDHLWYVKYPLKGTTQHLIVATTRPETMLGDTALAVSPSDSRYAPLVGRTVILPLVGREIPVIADQAVDPQFGTGIVKVTPAHDPNDYWIAERFNENRPEAERMIPLTVFDTSARINENAPTGYRGLDRYEARKAVLRDLEALGLVEKDEPYVHNVGRCYRCDTVIEPYLSDQWFVRMKPLAQPALEAVTRGVVRFHPERWVKTYEHWMTGIRDWCISRQLWWGHRIPVWYCANEASPEPGCRQPVVSREKPARCPVCSSPTLRQDEDVLDTWFSSWLWPFSVFGWPQDSQDLRYFYPTDTLVTAPDIIFFWVARMIMSGMEVMGSIPLPDGTPRTRTEELVPFRDVYFTSIIRDMKGRKMSKSLGNSPDPLDVINEYGADALRFTILYLAPLGQDVLYSNEKCEIGRNFANKIWNAGRFLLMNQAQLGASSPDGGVPEDALDLADRWILSRLSSTARELDSSLGDFEINQSTKILYEFAWHDFCDWYVEMIKGRLYGGGESGEVKVGLLKRAIWIFDQLLRMLHPFMPFVTEELWQHLLERSEGESLIAAAFPRAQERWIDKNAESEMAFVQDAINGIRNARGELSVPPSRELKLIISFPDRSREEVVLKYASYFERLARVTSILRLEDREKPHHSASVVTGGGELFIPLEGIIDLNEERQRLRKEIERVEALLRGTEAKLSKPEFTGKAPREVVAKEEEKLLNFKAILEKLKRNFDRLS